MAEVGDEETGREPAGGGRSDAASVIAQLWQEREQALSAPPSPRPLDTTPLPTRPPRDRDGNRARGAVAVVAVALLLGGGAGVFLAGRGGGSSTSRFVKKADAVCAPANGGVVALAKPSSYPELATAAGALVTASDTQVAGMRAIKPPSGPEGNTVTALLAAMVQTQEAGRSLQDAAGGKDDAATASAAQKVRGAANETSSKAAELGLSACGSGMQPGVDNVVAGAAGIVRTAFIAKADTVCRAGARQMEGLRPPRNDNRDVARFLGQVLQIAERMVTDLKALPVPPGDEGAVSDTMTALDKTNEKGREARDAAAGNDRSRFLAIEHEMTVLGTAADAKLDAYGLTTCGSNFGSR